MNLDKKNVQNDEGINETSKFKTENSDFENENITNKNNTNFNGKDETNLKNKIEDMNSGWKDASGAIGLGAELVSPIILGGLIGWWLDKDTPSQKWTLILLLVGMLIGAYNFYKVIKKLNKK